MPTSTAFLAANQVTSSDQPSPAITPRFHSNSDGPPPATLPSQAQVPTPLPASDKPPLERIPTEQSQPGLKDMALARSESIIIKVDQPGGVQTPIQSQSQAQPQERSETMRITSMSLIEPEVEPGAESSKQLESPPVMKPLHIHPLQHHPYSPAVRGAPKLQCMLCGGTIFEWWECVPCNYKVCTHCAPIANKGVACTIHTTVPAVHSCHSCRVPICNDCSTHHDYDTTTRICLKCRAQDRCCAGCGILCCCGVFCGIAGHKTVTG